MGKFFKKKPQTCNVCGQEKIIFRTMRSGITKLNYCQECYDNYYKKIEGRVQEQIKDMVKRGQKIDMKDALALTKKITDEIDNENNSENLLGDGE